MPILFGILNYSLTKQREKYFCITVMNKQFYFVILYFILLIIYFIFHFSFVINLSPVTVFTGFVFFVFFSIMSFLLI